MIVSDQDGQADFDSTREDASCTRSICYKQKHVEVPLSHSQKRGMRKREEKWHRRYFFVIVDQGKTKCCRFHSDKDLHLQSSVVESIDCFL